ncbi:MAG: dUTP diphosphatase [FCB group bacterium]|nr:dUTP diphosphatase [FCB group bacterium]
MEVRVEIQAVEDRKPKLPEYQTGGSAGADIFACLDGPLEIMPGKTAAVPTGFRMAIPEGYEAQIRPRSGLGLKHNVSLINSPGTIDSDYRGEVKILLTNFGTEAFTVEPYQRIAQMVIAPVIQGRFEFCSELPESERGTGGFGHTGG